MEERGKQRCGSCWGRKEMLWCVWKDRKRGEDRGMGSDGTGLKIRRGVVGIPEDWAWGMVRRAKQNRQTTSFGQKLVTHGEGKGGER